MTAPPPYGAPQPSVPPRLHRPASGRDPLAFTAVILGAVPLLLDLAQPFVQASLVRSQQLDLYGIVVLIQSIVIFLLGVGAIVTGAIAIRRGASRALAGIGLGFGVAAVVRGILAALYPLVFSLFGAF